MFFNKVKRGKMIDIHCHVLPKVDDGSQSMEQTMEMIRIASEEGIEAMIVTPHFKAGQRNASCTTIMDRIKLVQEEADRKGYDVRLFPGNEILYHEDVINLLEQDRVLTLNGTDRVLIEFLPSDEYTYIRNALDNVRAQGYVPVLAHVERYECMVKDYNRVKELKQMDVEIQINAAGVTGELGRKIQQFLFTLVKNRLIDYVGTDAHSDGRRSPRFQESYRILSKKFDAEYIDEIFYHNASAIIEVE